MVGTCFIFELSLKQKHFLNTKTDRIMKKQTLKIESFKSQVSKKQIINSLIAKNLKGGSGKCPPPPEWD